jgi:hypothetical protein
MNRLSRTFVDYVYTADEKQLESLTNKNTAKNRTINIKVVNPQNSQAAAKYLRDSGVTVPEEHEYRITRIADQLPPTKVELPTTQNRINWNDDISISEFVEDSTLDIQRYPPLSAQPTKNILSSKKQKEVVERPTSPIYISRKSKF